MSQGIDVPYNQHLPNGHVHLKKPAFKHGDIFAVPLPDGRFLPGRVMLDIYGCLKKRMLPHDSPLPGLGKAVLAEMYSVTSKHLDFEKSAISIPGAYVDSDEIGVGWPIIGNLPVDPHDISFPETLIGFNHENGEVAFECGELRINVPLHEEDARKINAYKSPHTSFLWPITCAQNINRPDLVPEKYRSYNGLVTSDLRYTLFRDAIFKHLPINPDDSYFTQQCQMGFNIGRLYA